MQGGKEAATLGSPNNLEDARTIAKYTKPTKLAF